MVSAGRARHRRAPRQRCTICHRRPRPVLCKVLRPPTSGRERGLDRRQQVLHHSRPLPSPAVHTSAQLAMSNSLRHHPSSVRSIHIQFAVWSHTLSRPTCVVVPNGRFSVVCDTAAFTDDRGPVPPLTCHRRHPHHHVTGLHSVITTSILLCLRLAPSTGLL